MNAKELADRVVALGVGHKVSDIHYALYNTNRIGIEMLADQFINDGRVMLALVVMLRKRGYSFLLHSMPDRKALMTVSSPLPNQKKWASQIVGDDDCPVIIEACCEALENGQ